jgi:CBS domain-containing protein
MAQHVAEIMNRELFTVSPDEPVGRVRGYLDGLGIDAAPVCDDERKPLGFVSRRDLSRAPDRTRVHVVMSAPAASVPAVATIEQAARQLTQAGVHHLVCTDADGKAVGFVGTLDVLRGLLSEPVSHPSAFPHYDASTGLAWCDDTVLSLDGVQAAPDGPGLLALVENRAGRPNRIVWSEATPNVRTRLLALLSDPAASPPHVRPALEREALWFRAAAAPSSRALAGAVD